MAYISKGKQKNIYNNPLKHILYIPMHKEQCKGYTLHILTQFYLYICFNLDLIIFLGWVLRMYNPIILPCFLVPTFYNLLSESKRF